MSIATSAVTLLNGGAWLLLGSGAIRRDTREGGPLLATRSAIDLDARRPDLVRADGGGLLSEIVFIAKESDPNEPRVAGSPETVKKIR
ncbi:hypothetical protein, partial [Sinorhizobium sojae]|uniref:hypothetical protein n=1 Tax=Sinorhizobium sojae TaxID=716925 RepID=UPI0012F95731